MSAAASGERKRAVITGASSGIGAASAYALAAHGYSVIIGARRVDRIRKIADEIDGKAIELDVTDPQSVNTFAEQVSNEPLHVLVNNAGGAKGLDRIEDMKEDDWRWMWETNVLGLARMTQALIPALRRSQNGLIINLGSTAALESYEGGSGYTSTKHGVRAITQSLRFELLGEPIRVTEIDPGMVETEFSLVRFDHDEKRARSVYQGLDPLTAADIAELIAFIATRPTHVNIDQLVVRPVAQASSGKLYRKNT
ncbi:MAG: SDR family NAD(P)-dependent oxidoreductase [Actinomycetota bacterium]